MLSYKIWFATDHKIINKYGILRNIMLKHAWLVCHRVKMLTAVMLPVQVYEVVLCTQDDYTGWVAFPG